MSDDDCGVGSSGVALLGDAEVEVEGVVGAENIEDVVVVGVANVAAAAAVDVDGADVATAGVGAAAAAAGVVAAVVDAAGAGAADADAGAAGVAGVADVDASLLLAWGFLRNGGSLALQVHLFYPSQGTLEHPCKVVVVRAECPGEPFAEGGDSVGVGVGVECGEDVSRDHSREECECPFVIVSVRLVAECVHDPSLHGLEGVEEEEREEECRRPEEGQAQDGDDPLAKTGPGRAGRKRRRNVVETNEFSDERPTIQQRAEMMTTTTNTITDSPNKG
ncbi:hypothetical protein B9Z19DRAFT_1135847 [Tuber borchii]|uniref:Uncharacterized protein n=1 Tax=Tuber borchii TaxID=42251 RepID=A0A2T6ZC67_TUBBO|nr:hypothetical protein B9Z19DRAFT_1135847 [Tuber borchii]